MRRYAQLKASRGTVWPSDVREHVRSHYAGCIGPLAGMKGACDGGIELDHIRASHGMGMKSESTVRNAAPLCNWHHKMKTEDGKRWRPALLTVVVALMRSCPRCSGEDAHAAHVDPCSPECHARATA